MNFAPALTIGILAASLYAAECNVTHTEGHSSADINQGYLATALYLYEGNYLEMSNMDKREPSVVNVSCTDTAWVYRSELDSTMIVLVSEKAVKVARVPYSDDPNGYSDSLYSVHYDDIRSVQGLLYQGFRLWRLRIQPSWYQKKKRRKGYR